MPKIPEMINDSRTYVNGNADYYPTTEFELGTLSTLTSEVTGVGVAGKIDAPVVGHLDSIEPSLTMRVPTKEAMAFVAGAPIELENYADVQNFDAGTNSYAHSQLRIALRGRIKSLEVGTLQRGDKTDTKITMEAHYVKADYDGTTVCEIDKYGYKAVVNGVDLLADVKQNLGM